MCIRDSYRAFSHWRLAAIGQGVYKRYLVGAMGDNRDDSTDSRFLNHVGFIPAENLVGRADLIFFSVNNQARIWEIWKWPTAIRFSRRFDGFG